MTPQNLRRRERGTDPHIARVLVLLMLGWWSLYGLIALAVVALGGGAALWLLWAVLS